MREKNALSYASSSDTEAAPTCRNRFKSPHEAHYKTLTPKKLFKSPHNVQGRTSTPKRFSPRILAKTVGATSPCGDSGSSDDELQTITQMQVPLEPAEKFKSRSDDSVSIRDVLNEVKAMRTDYAEEKRHNRRTLSGLKLQLEEINGRLPAGQTPSSLLPALVLAPAATPSELKQLVQHPSCEAMLVSKGDTTLAKTVSSMAKALMTRSLAMQYSVTGLGLKRQMTKLPFKETAACRLMQKALLAIPEFRDATNKEFYATLSHALKNSLDWEGHRGKRRRLGASQQEEKQPLPGNPGSEQVEQHQPVHNADILLEQIRSGSSSGEQQEDMARMEATDESHSDNNDNEGGKGILSRTYRVLLGDA